MADTYLPDDAAAIQALQKRIDGFQGPTPYTAEQEAQIMKGRRTQAEIDAGRQTIQGRLAANNASNDQLGKLNDQLAQLKTAASGRSQQNAVDTKKKADNAWASTPSGVAYNFGTKVAPYIAGEGAGYGLGTLMKGLQATTQTERNAKLAALAQSIGPRSEEAARVAGLIPSQYGALRVAGRMAPFLAPGAGLIGAGQVLKSDAMAPTDETELGGDLRRATGGLVQGTGAGLATAGLKYGFNPKVAPDAASISAIMDGPKDPTPTGPQESDLATMRAQAVREARIQDISKMKASDMQAELRSAGVPVSGIKADLAQRIHDVRYGAGDAGNGVAASAAKRGIVSRLASAFGPAAIGGGALLAAGGGQSDAEARGLSPADASMEGLKAGGEFGAGAGAGAYGLNKLLSALSGTMAGKVAARALPPVAAALTARDAYNFATDPTNQQDAQIGAGIYGNDRHPGMNAPGDIESRYIEQQTRGPNVTSVSKTTPDAAMMGASMENPAKRGYGRQALIEALLGQR